MAEHALLVTIAELPQYGISSAFLDQFAPRAIEVIVSTGGTIGTMAVEWRYVGDSTFSAAYKSSGVAPWVFTIGDAFTTLTFPAGSYALDEVYTVDAAGNVTGGSQAVTATRYDVRQTVAQAVTDECLGRIFPQYTAPLTAWAADLKGYAARIIAYELKSVAGLAPVDAVPGDGNLFERAKQARETLSAIGRGEMKLQGIADSSAAIGDGIMVDPVSDDRRGW